MVSFTYEDIYEYDIKLYLFVKEKYGLDEKAWRLFMNSYIDPDEYALKSLKYKVQGISSCTADSLLSVKRIHAHEGFGDNFIETFKKYRQTPIFLVKQMGLILPE